MECSIKLIHPTPKFCPSKDSLDETFRHPHVGMYATEVVPATCEGTPISSQRSQQNLMILTFPCQAARWNRAALNLALKHDPNQAFTQLALCPRRYAQVSVKLLSDKHLRLYSPEISVNILDICRYMRYLWIYSISTDICYNRYLLLSEISARYPWNPQISVDYYEISVDKIRYLI